MIDIEANADLAMFNISCLQYPSFWRDVVAVADVIVGVDCNNPTRGSIFYGNDTLRRISATGRAALLRSVRIVMDFSPGSKDVAYLRAAVMFTRGRCDYEDESAARN